MSRALGRSVRALGSRHIVALASMLAFAACGDETSVNRTTNSQYFVAGAPDDSGAAGGSQEAADDQAPAAGDPEEALLDTDTDGLQLDAVVRAAGTYSQYIAFGDSFTSGFGLSLPTKANPCARSQRAWPPQVNNLLKIGNPLVFAACSGATTRDVLGDGPLVGMGKPQAEPQIALLPPPEQLHSALITIQIGGNDIKLDDSIQQCVDGLNALKKAANLTDSLTALSLLSPDCANLDWLLTNFSSIVDTSLKSSLDETFRALRKAAPNATIVAVGYPHLVDATSACTGLWKSVPASYRQRMNDLGDAINAKIASAAADAGIRSITSDVVTAFAGREACSPREMISSLNMHPNAAGQTTYAQLVAKEVPVAP
jgi:lysophospholipase L1-like esterase